MQTEKTNNKPTKFPPGVRGLELPEEKEWAIEAYKIDSNKSLSQEEMIRRHKENDAQYAKYIKFL